MNAHTQPPTPAQVIAQIVAIHAPGSRLEARQRLERAVIKTIARGFTTPGLFDVIDHALNLEAEAQEVDPCVSSMCGASELLLTAARECRDAVYTAHPET